MASRVIRRRIHHREADGRNDKSVDSSDYDTLSEPLLGMDSDDDSPSQNASQRNQQDLWDKEKKEKLHWTFLFSNVIAQWAQWLANIVLSTGSMVGRLLPLLSVSRNGENQVRLSPLQEERLWNLKQRLGVPFDGTRVEHQDGLRQLWKLAYPLREIPPLKSELWKDMGWQGTDPSTDFSVREKKSISPSLASPAVASPNVQDTKNTGRCTLTRCLIESFLEYINLHPRRLKTAMMNAIHICNLYFFCGL